MNKSFSILFASAFLLYISCLSSCIWDTTHEDEVLDWTSDMSMESGKTYGDYGKIFRVWDTLTIPPNVTIKGAWIDLLKATTVSEGTSLLCHSGGYVSVKEKLIINGTKDNPITVDGWIWLDSNVSVGNSFTYMNLDGEYHGGIRANTMQNYVLTMEHCVIKNADTSALILGESTAVKISNCFFDNNAPYDIEMLKGNISKIDTSNTINKGIKVSGMEDHDNVILPVTSYFGSFGSNGNVEVFAGTSFELMSNSFFRIGSSGTVRMYGTEDMPITIKSGLLLDRPETDTQINVLSHVKFSNSKFSPSGYMGSYGGVKAAVIFMGANVTLNNCYIEGYKNWAVQETSNTPVIYFECTGFDSTNIYVSDSVPYFE